MLLFRFSPALSTGMDADENPTDLFNLDEIFIDSPTSKNAPQLVEPLKLSSIYSDEVLVTRKRKSTSPSSSKKKMQFDSETELSADYILNLLNNPDFLIPPLGIFLVWIFFTSRT